MCGDYNTTESSCTATVTLYVELKWVDYQHTESNQADSDNQNQTENSGIVLKLSSLCVAC